MTQPDSDAQVRRCEHGVAWNGRTCKRCHPRSGVYVPNALAQRILAELDQGDVIARALASELRAVIGK